MSNNGGENSLIMKINPQRNKYCVRCVLKKGKLNHFMKQKSSWWRDGAVKTSNPSATGTR